MRDFPILVPPAASATTTPASPPTLTRAACWGNYSVNPSNTTGDTDRANIQAALDKAVAYSKERRQHGKPIGGHQLIQGMLAEAATELDAARLLVYRAFNLIDHGVRSEVQSAMAKWYATEMAVNVASKALQIHGGNGITKDFGVELLFRNARMMPIPDGTTEIQKLIIGRALTGINAFS